MENGAMGKHKGKTKIIANNTFKGLLSHVF